MKYSKYTRDEIVDIAHECLTLNEFSNKIGFSIRNRNINEFNDYFGIDIKNILYTNNRIFKLKNELAELEQIVVCDKCGKSYRNGDRIKDNKSGKHFCSDYCSKLYSSDFSHTDECRKRISDKLKSLNKSIICDNCGFEFNVHISSNRCLCDSCVVKLQKDHIDIGNIADPNLKVCKMCGSVGIGNCKNPDICKHIRLLPRMIKYLGFDEDTIGSDDVVYEFNRVKNFVHDLYWNQKMSIQQISDLVGYESSAGNFAKLLQHFIDFRNSSDSISNAILNGRLIPPTNITYKSGYHTTWDNKIVYYRSSYELEYCVTLDQYKIPYEMEALRITYYDTIKCRERIAIPDFLLKDQNKIVEVKSDYTFDKQNMIDKYTKYKELGYNFGLLYEHKMFDENSFVKGIM